MRDSARFHFGSSNESPLGPSSKALEAFQIDRAMHELLIEIGRRSRHVCHLHPNDAGYEAMAGSIDLGALLGNK
jgi:hypothetical protein